MKGCNFVKNKKFIGFFVFVLCSILIVGGYFYQHRLEESTDDAAIDGHVAAIAPKIQGYVKKIYVTDNQEVKAGDLLFEIDATDYITKRDQAKATLASAQAALKAAQSNTSTTKISAPANFSAASAQVVSAKATWEKNAADRARAERLYAEDAYSKQQLDQAVANEESSRAVLAQMEATKQAANTSDSTIETSQNNADQLAAQVTQAEAALKQAEDDLENTKIVAPMDGYFTKKSVEEGAYVQTAQQLASLVSKQIWVTANFKETQLQHMKPGQHVDITVDAFPDLMLHGIIDSAQAGTGSRFSLFPAENATGNFVKIVQRVPVKITLDENAEPSLFILGPGMSVNATVHTESR